jgi:hypothetical protein
MAQHGGTSQLHWPAQEAGSSHPCRGDDWYYNSRHGQESVAAELQKHLLTRLCLRKSSTACRLVAILHDTQHHHTVEPGSAKIARLL